MIYPWLTAHWDFFTQRLEQSRLAHALMIEGPDGGGKNALAAAMVARLLCTENEPEACGRCFSCKLLAGGAHPDRFDIQPEEDSTVIKVDQVRELIASLNLTCSVSQRKVAYIHPAQNMNMASANALLKCLEEPVGDAVLILVCSEPSRLPVTIRSRCQSIVIHEPDAGLVLQWLKETSARPEADVSMALAAAGGSPLRAASYLQAPESNAYGQVQEALATLLTRPAAVSQVSTGLAKLGPDDLWRWLSMCVTELVKSVMGGKGTNWLPADSRLQVTSLLALQQQADLNRRLSASPIRGDLLLQDWLIRWAEQSFQ